MVRKSLPLAQQLVSEILSGIEAGDLARDDGLLPSEAELSKHFDVSRATIREALSKLEQRGVIIRRQGVGTFLAPQQPVLDAGLERLESLDTLARRIGLETHMGEAEIVEREATVREAECLHGAPGMQVLAVARVIYTGTRPVAYLVDVVPADCLRAQELGEGFSGSVLDVFLRRGEPALSHSHTDIIIDAADALTAHKLVMQRGDVLLKLEARLYSRDGQVVDYSLSYFVPGYFHLHVVRRVDPCDVWNPH